MEMANYIMQILKANIVMMWSWGFNHPVAIKDGLRFKVQGFKHKGKVEVKYNIGTDYFDVTLINKKNEVVKTINDVSLDILATTIDEAVEKVDNYKERVDKEYGL